MTKPKIELRKISYSKSLSEETAAYTADLYVDGVLLAHVSNHGQGGSDMQHPAKGKTFDDVTALDRIIKATYPPRTFEAGGAVHSYEADIETVCAGLLDDHLAAKDLKRTLASKVVFKKADGRIYTVKIQKGDPRDQVIAVVKKRNGVDKTLNEMPFDEALAVYKTTV